MIVCWLDAWGQQQKNENYQNGPGYERVHTFVRLPNSEITWEATNDGVDACANSSGISYLWKNLKSIDVLLWRSSCLRASRKR